ncbi:MAG: hypothetical protein WBG90_03025 [Saonia sp.]
MGIAILIMATILGYSTSKYFPLDIPLLSKKSSDSSFKLVRKIVSVVLYGLALAVFILNYGSGTGTLLLLFTATLVLSLSLLALPYKSSFFYAFLVVAIAFLIFDIVLYAS